ncbi:MAG: hypothetical protein HY075_04895 [Deltaproteobacteria bacterium]|nr:hypothetical protein [Deltaproteobacteria bacterium]
MQKNWFEKAAGYVDEFVKSGGVGQDPFARVYEERRKDYSLFSTQMTDDQIRSLKRYIFNYDRLPSAPADKPVQAPNLIAGEWKMAAKNARMTSPGDRRIVLSEMPDSGPGEVDAALTYAYDWWNLSGAFPASSSSAPISWVARSCSRATRSEPSATRP